ARLLVPFSGEKISVSYRLPISETVIVGDVPDTYVFVPENEILDAI
ncbi:MAG: sporulation protein YunB, partial [Firmicutes bacterium]|nr:sporulation protein YunB [Bacillota bacterium]